MPQPIGRDVQRPPRDARIDRTQQELEGGRDREGEQIRDVARFDPACHVLREHRHFPQDGGP
jgi:hypothetical protein